MQSSGRFPAHSNTWFHIANPRTGSSKRLFCVPQAGGGTTMFHSWSRHLPDWIEVAALQLPGRERRRAEPLVTELAAIADTIAQEMTTQVTRHFALYGHSLGALLAFELARRLQATGHPPCHLFLAARRAPHVPSRAAPIHHLDNSAFMEALETRWGALPRVVRGNPDLLALFLPIIRADMTMLETYRYAPSEPLDCPLTVFGGDRDRSVAWDELDAWRQQTTGPFHLMRLPGDHFFPQSAQRQLLGAIQQSLLPVGLVP